MMNSLPPFRVGAAPQFLPQEFAVNWKRTCFFAFVCALAVPAFVSRVGRRASKKLAQITFAVTVTATTQDRYVDILKGAGARPTSEGKHIPSP